MASSSTALLRMQPAQPLLLLLNQYSPPIKSRHGVIEVPFGYDNSQSCSSYLVLVPVMVVVTGRALRLAMAVVTEPGADIAR